MAEAMSTIAAPPALNIIIPNRRDIGVSRHEWPDSEIQSQLPTEVLLITVKDHEFRSCYSYMKQVKRSWCDDVGMVDLGEFGEKNVRVALMRCSEGAINAALLVENAAKILRPKVLVFAGDCATVNPAKAKLGDVVISAKLATRSNTRIKRDGEEELYGIKANVSRHMAKLILYASDGWNPPIEDPAQSEEVKVHCQAVVISVPEVIENLTKREILLNNYPDAIGLENEGEGMLSKKSRNL